MPPQTQQSARDAIETSTKTTTNAIFYTTISAAITATSDTINTTNTSPFSSLKLYGLGNGKKKE
eukprot:14647439-Ditylum_brightwellii.AAC.1